MLFKNKIMYKTPTDGCIVEYLNTSTVLLTRYLIYCTNEQIVTFTLTEHSLYVYIYIYQLSITVTYIYMQKI